MTHARDYVGIGHEYARAVVRDRKGKRHCKWERLAAKRHLDDLRRAKRDKSWPFYFDPWHGNNVCDFLEKLPHVQGQWETPTLHLQPADIFAYSTCFGWRRKEDERRRFTVVYLEKARKGAKSTQTAGIGLYVATCEGEPGPEVIIGATTGEQAGKVFKPMQQMVSRTPDLRSEFGLEPFTRSIAINSKRGGHIQTINSRSSTQDGWNPYMGILDELHAHKDRGLFDVIKSSFGARKQPLLWIITTAGYNTSGVCYEQRQFLTKVLEGVIDADHYFGIIYTLDEKDDPFDESKWVKANPMLGITPTWDSMRDYAKEAKASPASEGEFCTKRLNVWLNAANAWLPLGNWNACADPSLSWEDFEGLDCYAGGDLADKDDITALVLSAIDVDEVLLLKPVFFLPEAVLTQAAHVDGGHGAPYRAWSKEGWLTLTPGNWVDFDEVEGLLREWVTRFSVRMMTFDQFAAAQQMASRLNEDLGSPDRPIAQILHKSAPNVTDPAKELEARIKAGRVRHDGSPVMTWMISNAVVSRKVDGSIIPKKETPDSANKIDGVDAAVNAIAPWVFKTDGGPSVYEERGLLVL